MKAKSRPEPISPTEAIRKAVKDAFFEGYFSYETPCVPYNNVESAWSTSNAKVFHDSFTLPPKPADRKGGAK